MIDRVGFSLFLILTLICSSAFAGINELSVIQQGPGRGPSAVRDLDREKESAHSLDVAKFYFYKRKPGKNDKQGWEKINKSVEDRLLEILDTNPSFAHIDDVYFLLGELYLRMGESGKAVDNWNRALKETSDEKLKASIQKRLDETKTQGQSKEEKRG